MYQNALAAVLETIGEEAETEEPRNDPDSTNTAKAKAKAKDKSKAKARGKGNAKAPGRKKALQAALERGWRRGG